MSNYYGDVQREIVDQPYTMNVTVDEVVKQMMEDAAKQPDLSQKETNGVSGDDTVCEDCGSDNLERKYWVEMKTKDIVVPVEEDYREKYYCQDCGEQCNVVLRKNFKKDE